MTKHHHSRATAFLDYSSDYDADNCEPAPVPVLITPYQDQGELFFPARYIDMKHYNDLSVGRSYLERIKDWMHEIIRDSKSAYHSHHLRSHHLNSHRLFSSKGSSITPGNLSPYSKAQEGCTPSSESSTSPSSESSTSTSSESSTSSSDNSSRRYNSYPTSTIDYDCDSIPKPVPVINSFSMFSPPNDSLSNRRTYGSNVRPSSSTEYSSNATESSSSYSSSSSKYNDDSNSLLNPSNPLSLLNPANPASPTNIALMTTTFSL